MRDTVLARWVIDLVATRAAKQEPAEAQQSSIRLKTRRSATRRCKSSGSGQALNTCYLTAGAAVQLIGCLVLLALASRSAKADHALSEVWSEGDGLQMKYLTNHDDMLSTKGSELSLVSASTNREQLNKHQQPAEGAEAGGESSTGSEESGAGEQPTSAAANQQEETTSGLSTTSEAAEEQEGSSAPPAAASSGSDDSGADSSSRQTTNMRLPAASKQQANKQRFAPPSGESSSSEGSNNDAESDGESGSYDGLGASGRASGQQQPKRKWQSKSMAQEPPMSYESALEQAEGGGEEQANADHGADNSEEQQARSEAPKFRPPGRLFKEALRMNSVAADGADESSEGQNRAPTSGQESSDGESAPEVHRTNANEAAAANNSDGDESEGNSNNNEEDNNNNNNNNVDRQSAAAINGRQRSRPIAASDDGYSSGPEAASGESDLLDRAAAGDGRPPQQLNLHRGQQQQAYGKQGNYFRSVGAAPQRPSSGSFYDHPGRSMASGSAAAASRGPGAHQGAARFAPGKPPADGAYFRSAIAEQRRPVVPQSPDNERDDFISPGHFPGSMAHLTQAASETRKEELPVAAKQPDVPVAKEATATGDQKQVTGSSDLVNEATSESAASASPSAGSGSGGNSNPQAASSQVAPATLTTGQVQLQQDISSDTQISSRAATDQSTVTPEPEAQPESQQIMAPILISTTTMAPMAATSTTSTTTTTSQAPSLKRFKFRKYR